MRTASVMPWVVLPGDRVAEVDEQPVAQVLRDVAMMLTDHGVAHLLIGAHHVAEHLGIEPGSQAGGSDQITEHHRKLPTFRLGRARRGADGFRHVVGNDGLGPGWPGRL